MAYYTAVIDIAMVPLPVGEINSFQDIPLTNNWNLGMELVVEMPAYLKVLENEQILEGCQNMEERNGIKYASIFMALA